MKKIFYCNQGLFITKRDIDIMFLLFELKSFKEIAKRYDLTIERIRQICFKMFRRVVGISPEGKDFILNNKNIFLTKLFYIVNREYIEKMANEMYVKIMANFERDLKEHLLEKSHNFLIEKILPFINEFKSIEDLILIEKASILNKSISDLDLTVRSWNCLRSANICSIEDLVSKTEFEIRKIPNLGERSFNEIKEALLRHHLSFKVKNQSRNNYA